MYKLDLIISRSRVRIWSREIRVVQFRSWDCGLDRTFWTEPVVWDSGFKVRATGHSESDRGSPKVRISSSGEFLQTSPNRFRLTIIGKCRRRLKISLQLCILTVYKHYATVYCAWSLVLWPVVTFRGRNVEFENEKTFTREIWSFLYIKITEKMFKKCCIFWQFLLCKIIKKGSKKCHIFWRFSEYHL